MTEFRDAFSLFDRDGDGQLDAADLGSFLRALGRNPTQAQVSALIKDKPSFSLPDCLSMLASMPAPDPAQLEAELKAAFMVFDKDGKGKIPSGELRHIVTSLGERLSEEEADEMLRQADPESSGFVDYSRFIKSILSA